MSGLRGVPNSSSANVLLLAGDVATGDAKAPFVAVLVGVGYVLLLASRSSVRGYSAGSAALASARRESNRRVSLCDGSDIEPPGPSVETGPHAPGRADLILEGTDRVDPLTVAIRSTTLPGRRPFALVGSRLG
jgi:hypothetical protein